MKAVINNMTFEGTPEEIMKIKKLIYEESNGKKCFKEEVTRLKGCPNVGRSCYCTGACFQKDVYSHQSEYNA